MRRPEDMAVVLNGKELLLREDLLRNLRVGKRKIAFDDTVTISSYSDNTEQFMYCMDGVEIKA